MSMTDNDKIEALRIVQDLQADGTITDDKVVSVCSYIIGLLDTLAKQEGIHACVMGTILTVVRTAMRYDMDPVTLRALTLVGSVMANRIPKAKQTKPVPTSTNKGDKGLN